MNEHFDRFIDERADSDAYGSAEAVVEAGLQLLEEQEADMRRMDEVFLREATPWTRETLAAAIQAGLDSGVAVTFDFDQLYDDIIAEDGGRA
jgi:putative addiction module CopG family antidote